MFGLKLALIQGSENDIVVRDFKWKARLKREEEASQKWSERWGYMLMKEDGVSNSPAKNSIEEERESVKGVRKENKYPPTTYAEIGWRHEHHRHFRELEKACLQHIHFTGVKKLK